MNSDRSIKRREIHVGRAADNKGLRLLLGELFAVAVTTSNPTALTTTFTYFPPCFVANLLTRFALDLFLGSFNFSLGFANCALNFALHFGFGFARHSFRASLLLTFGATGGGSFASLLRAPACGVIAFIAIVVALTLLFVLLFVRKQSGALTHWATILRMLDPDRTIN